MHIFALSLLLGAVVAICAGTLLFGSAPAAADVYAAPRPEYFIDQRTGLCFARFAGSNYHGTFNTVLVPCSPEVMAALRTQ